MKKNLISVFAALLGIVVVSCDSSDPEPTIDTEKRVTVKGKSTIGAASAGGRVASVDVTKFMVNIEDLELKIDELDERSASESTHSEAEFSGPFIVDLLTDALGSDFTSAEIPVGTYDELEFDLTPSRDASSDLDGKSVLMEGSIERVPFVFWTDEEESFEINFSGGGGDLVVENTGFVLFVDFNLDALFGANGTIDLSQAQDGNGDGVIEISPDDTDGNNILAVKILSELEEATELDEDEDLDEDGEGNSEDDDIDGDGVTNDVDNDDDNDGIDDDEDTDDDGDGIDDDMEDEDDDQETDDDEDDEQEETALKTMLNAGEWTLTSYIDESGNELSGEFAGFLFSFDPGDVLRADNSETQMAVEGEWETITNSDMPKLLIEFELRTGDFHELEEAWNIVSISETELELISSSDDGNSKKLIMEQL